MGFRSLHRAAIVALVGIVAILTNQRAQADLVVNPGYDLFQTVSPGTTFGGVEFNGVPLGSFNFGGALGVQAVDGTDTIIHRIDTASVASPGLSATIRIELLSLNLQSTVLTDFGGGLDFYFINLQSARGGPASVGTMTITFGADQTNPNSPPTAGTFTSAIDVFFDVRKGSLNGPIFISDALPLTSSGTSWSHFPPNGALQLPAVNAFLNGTDHLRDFFPVPPLVEVFPTGARHTVEETGFQPAVPEPSALFSGSLGALFCAALIFRSRRRAG